MPLILKKEENNIFISVWKITESLDELTVLYPNIKCNILKTEKRKKEFICSRVLLNLYSKNLKISYSKFGNPILNNNQFISISHCSNLVCIAISKEKIGIDLEEISENGPLNILKSETYRNVDIPLLIGAKLGFLRLQAGPVAHFYLDSTSDLFSFSGYKHNFKSATYGGQIGLGVDVWKFRLDILYETNLSKFGEHIEIDGEQFAFDDEAGRVILTLGARF